MDGLGLRGAVPPLLTPDLSPPSACVRHLPPDTIKHHRLLSLNLNTVRCCKPRPLTATGVQDSGCPSVPNAFKPVLLLFCFLYVLRCCSLNCPCPDGRRRVLKSEQQPPTLRDHRFWIRPSHSCSHVACCVFTGSRRLS